MREGTVITLVALASFGVAGALLLLDRGREPESPPPTEVEAPPAAAPSASSASALPLPLARTDASAGRAPPPEEPLRAGVCPADAVLVEGDYCPFVAHKCKTTRKSAPAEAPSCEEYQNLVLCEGALARLRFCIDRFEYPNRAGVLPAVLVSFDEASRACELEGKRLCTHREWTFACEGEQMLPFASGLTRDASSCQCNLGPTARIVPSRGPSVAAQLLAVDRRAPSGERAACVSPFGVSDLGGNVAEWTEDPVLSKTREPFASVIAGGSWGAGPSECRARDDAHPPPHRAAQLGFRCCTEAQGETPAAPRRGSRERGEFRPIFPGGN